MTKLTYNGKTLIMPGGGSIQTLPTKKSVLLSDSSTYLYVGNRFDKTNYNIKFTINRDGKKEFGTLDISVLDEYNSEVSNVTTTLGDDLGFDFGARNKDLDFYGDSTNIGTTTGKWSNTLIGPNNKMYGIPNTDSRIIEFDPESGDINFYTDPSIMISTTSVIFANKIYAFPSDDDYMYEFNIDTKQFKFFDIGGSGLSVKFRGNPAVILNNKIYVFPFNYDSILEIDPNESTVNKINTGVTPVFFNFVIAPILGDNDKIYYLPSDYPTIMEFNPADGSINFLGDASILTDPSIVGSSIRRWVGVVKADNGKIYGIPSRASKVLEFNPSDGSINLLGNLDSLSVASAKWNTGTLSSDGKIYAFPWITDHILQINTLDGSVNIYGSSQLPIVNTGWGTCVEGLNNKIYSLPYKETRILEFDPTDGSINFFDISEVPGTYKFDMPGQMFASSNNRLYGVPLRADRAIEFNPDNGSIHYIGLNELTPGLTTAYRIINEFNNKLYSIPSDETRILEIDPYRRDVQLIAKDISTNTSDGEIVYTIK